jgi:hypothetical protein
VAIRPTHGRETRAVTHSPDSLAVHRLPAHIDGQFLAPLGRVSAKAGVSFWVSAAASNPECIASLKSLIPADNV